MTCKVNTKALHWRLREIPKLGTGERILRLVC